jgi:aspartyl-tRNA(Asn)/glutamyl-tRNA(Gln) amidotransferase subunit B
MTHEMVIGLEIHAELKTASKVFCGCPNAYGAAPNTHTCPVCLGMPGALPVLNRQAVAFAAKAGMAMHCEIAAFSKMDRKNYFYPDMPKAYQISQYDLPFCRDGYVEIDVAGERRQIGIERIHLEEDAGKLMHDPYAQGSLVDYNRCGVPLIEIVSRPDMRSPEEARLFMEAVKEILEFADISDCRMQEGSLRADVNLSLRPAGQETLGTRTEMKNINSLRAVQRAAAAEALRQEALLLSGKPVVQQTRRWDDNKGESFSMRSKEEAMDYRYFPEPDLVPVVMDPEWLAELRDSLPELPQARRERYIGQMGIPPYDAGLLTGTRQLSDLFERTAAVCENAKAASNWMMGEVLRRMKERGDDSLDPGVTGDQLGRIIRMVEAGDITQASGKKLLDAVQGGDADPSVLVDQMNLRVQRDEGAITRAVEAVLAENPQAVADWASGKGKAMGFLMGQIMGRLKGKADPAQVKDQLQAALARTGGGNG